MDTAKKVRKPTNKDVVTELGLEAIYYYSKYIKGEQRSTTCILVREGKIQARGIAICSKLDEFRKDIGRIKAFGYAVRAIKNGFLSNVIMNRTTGIADYCQSNYAPMPSKFEMKLLGIIKKEE